MPSPDLSVLACSHLTSLHLTFTSPISPTIPFPSPPNPTCLWSWGTLIKYLTTVHIAPLPWLSPFAIYACITIHPYIYITWMRFPPELILAIQSLYYPDCLSTYKLMLFDLFVQAIRTQFITSQENKYLRANDAIHIHISVFAKRCCR